MDVKWPVLMYLTVLSLGTALLPAEEAVVPGDSEPSPAVSTESLPSWSRWSAFGGLNFVYNSDGEGVSIIAQPQSDGTSGGLLSAPSPLTGFFGAAYRYPISPRAAFAPSLSVFTVRYLWDESTGRALPAEIENRTALVPTILLDFPVLWTVPADRFLFSLGGGLAIAVRYGFLDSGVNPDEIRAYETLTAAGQVAEVNKYLWGSCRWLYPTAQAGVRYQLDTGWGAGFVVRAGIPVFNLWSKPALPFMDSFMLMAALEITPPAKKTADSAGQSAETPAETP